MKSIRKISATAVFLILGLAVPAHARQEQQDKEKPPKQEEKAKTAPQEQKDKAQEQPAAKPAKQEEKAPAKKQDEAKPPKQEQQPKQDAKQQDKPVKRAEQQQPKSQPQTKNEQNGSSSRPQRTQQAIAHQKAQPALRLTAVSSSRIPDARFQSNFGRQHNFRISSPRMVNGYSRFQYGGYWFGFAEPWPDGWYYTENVYIDFIDGGYYLYNPYYPGARVSITVVL